ncbi:helix-turn-helix transcriptional regulator [Paenibacillus frigoriresistens]|uniref:helix-turn-helix domain-containing protein n=1 Tax=Paenibacillus alginolyticus TaxID=59839 RepID=UPI0015673A5F|nr:AraC family transcriptional regulator [Paenibacillus frigoriresistens]NRF90370.1 helix-turn-helix transcriptional regulator [Paenibacillus frigoriresistens]
MAIAKSHVITADFVSHTRKYEASFHLDTYLLRLQYEGSCWAVIDGEKHVLETGSLLLLSPGDSYELIIEGRKDGEQPVSDFYIYCNGDWVEEWWAKHKRQKISKLPMDSSMLNIWKQINLEKRRRAENKEILDYQLRILCLNMDRSLYENNSHLPPRKQSFLVYRMKTYIEEHATENFSLQDVADHLDLSISRTVSLFKAAFGKTVMQYTIDVRLSIAVERMQYSKMTLEQIAETCGFGTYSYFFRSFRSRYGTSPGIYREKNINEKLM